MLNADRTTSAVGVRPMPRRLWRYTPAAKASAFRVARPSADHAVAAAEFVAGLQRDVLRLPELRRDRIALGAADLAAVDRERGARVLHARHQLALRAGALAHRLRPRRRQLPVVERVAIGCEIADRQRARRLAARSVHQNDAEGRGNARAGPHETDHERPLPRN